MKSIFKKSALALITTAMLLPLQANEKATSVDNEYAAKVWKFMEENNFLGDKRIRSFPFPGNNPHGSIQEVVSTYATIDGHEGRLVIKHNYGSDNEITPKSVYGQKDVMENYAAVTIMFKREEGYDAANADWFWAEYDPKGNVLVYEGADLSGKAPLCIGCHTALGGSDLEVLNGK